MEMMELFAMGEYGRFVWSSYLLTLIVVIASTVQARRRHRQIEEGIRKRLRIRETSQ